MTGICLWGILAGMEKLASYLTANGITQAVFAGRVGISQGALSKLCAGPKGPSLETALAIERETGGTVSVADWPRFAVLAERLKSKRSRMAKPSVVNALLDGSPALNNQHADGEIVSQVGDTRPGGAV